MRSKSEVKSKFKKSNYELAIPFWYFPFEFVFLNRSKYLSVAKMNKNTTLDIHVDAGLHPITKQKKQLTIGIYISKDWKEENIGQWRRLSRVKHYR